MTTTALDFDAAILMHRLDPQSPLRTGTLNAAADNDGTPVTATADNDDFSQLLAARIDSDNDGNISVEELRSGIGDIRELLHTLDDAGAQRRAAAVTTAGDSTEPAATTNAAAATGDESYFSARRFSLPGLMSSADDLMTLLGHGQGDIPLYNTVMAQLLQR